MSSDESRDAPEIDDGVPKADVTALGVPYLSLRDEELLRACDVDRYRSSGPGGQHRNKVSSAVRLYHRPTGISAHGDESRSQHDNKRQALARLRMKIACQLRRHVDLAGPSIPETVRSCLFVAKGAAEDSARRLQVGRKDHRYWAVTQHLLDVLEACQGRLSEAADVLGITTSNFGAVLMEDRHAHAAAQDIRKRHGLGPLK